MSDILCVQTGNYSANIRLDQLCTLPRSKYRRLLKLVLSPSNRYPEGAALLEAYLNRAVDETGAALESAGVFFSPGWRAKTQAEHKYWVQRRDTYINMKGRCKP